MQGITYSLKSGVKRLIFVTNVDFWSIKFNLAMFVAALYDLAWLNRNRDSHGSPFLRVQDFVFKANKNADDHWKRICNSTLTGSSHNQPWNFLMNAYDHWKSICNSNLKILHWLTNLHWLTQMPHLQMEKFKLGSLMHSLLKDLLSSTHANLSNQCKIFKFIRRNANGSVMLLLNEPFFVFPLNSIPLNYFCYCGYSIINSLANFNN